MSTAKNLQNTDLYALFEIAENATTKDIKKAYRKKALKLHPDKNPDNPKAAALFHELSEALKILTDLGARAAYDHVRQAKKAAAARTAKLDDKRKKVKLDLEAREQAAEMENQVPKQAKMTLEQEIRRLREEGSRILQEEQFAMKKLLKQEAESRLNSGMAEPARLKVKWKTDDSDNNTYDEASLRKIFSKYGDVITLIVSIKKKRGSAIVEFSTPREANEACESEIGFPENPLTITWLSGKPLAPDGYTQHFAQKLGLAKESSAPKPNRSVPVVEEKSLGDEEDFEAMVLKRMRDMQAKKQKEKQFTDKT